jgi:hypothetical protein
MPNASCSPENPGGLAGGLCSGDSHAAPRTPFIAEAVETDLDSETRMEARVSEISSEGCYLDTLNPFPAGTRIRVVITHNDVTFTAIGSVTYEDHNMGMDVTFTAVEPEQQKVLGKWLAGAGNN